VATAARRAISSGRIGRLAQLFGFVQFEFAGALAVADGRYLARDDGEDGRQSVLVTETLGAPAPSGRRRRRPQPSEPEAPPDALPMARVTAVRAFQPFDDEEAAESWLEEALSAEERIEAVAEEGIGLLNRALHAQAAASADPRVRDLAAFAAVAVRIGYGSGEEVVAGRFAKAFEVDLRQTASRARQRADALRPQERVAAVLGGREQLDACETMLLRARADLDASRMREAALQLRVGLEALLAELPGALADPGHEEDMAQLQARRGAAGEAANVALKGPLDADRERDVRELVEMCERVLRRRRILRGG
jgi:hypothetical protein